MHINAKTYISKGILKSFKQGQNIQISQSMKTFRIVGIILLSIGLEILISGIIISIAAPDYNYFYYSGFSFPTWLFFVASFMGLIGSFLIFVKWKTKQTPS